MRRLPYALGYSAEEAGAAIGVSVSMFNKLVKEGTMPPARLIGTRRIWDIDELRAAFKALPHEDEEDVDEWADVG